MSWTTVWSKRLLNNPLVEETFELFLGWSFDATVEQNLEGRLASRYGNVGRAKDVITTLSRRLRDFNTVRPLIVMAKGGQRFPDWRDCCRLWIGATEEPFQLFALNWLYREREDGRYLVRSDDVRPFVVEIWKSRRIGRSLNDYGIIRTARDLIRTATNLGMLEGEGATRTFSSLAMSDDTLLYYAQLIAEVEGAPVRIVDAPLWRLAYMTPADVHAALLRLHQFKRLDYQVAGSLVQVSLPYRSTLEFAERLVA
jgi:hypothetical protein